MEINKGDYIYVINKNGKFLRKCIFADEKFLEWDFGWAFTSQLTRNNDKGKVKYILNLIG